MRSSGKLLVWANPAATGIASKTSVKMNRFVIAVLMKIWGQHHPNPKSPPETRGEVVESLCYILLIYYMTHNPAGEGDPPLAHPEAGPGNHVCGRVGSEKIGFQVH